MKRPSVRHIVRSSLGRLILPALLLAGLTGCATARIPAFESFATAGTTYTQAVTGLITEVGNTTVDADSFDLLQSRALSEVPLPTFRQRDQQMRAYLAELNRIQAQVTLLGNYFQALADLATSSAPQSFSTEVQSLATTLVGVTQEVRGTTIAQEAQIAAAAGGVGGLVVKGVQGRELKRELEARKQTISDILRLHQALLTVLGKQAQASIALTTSVNYDQQVVKPFLDAPVPQSQQEAWTAQRLSHLSQPVLVEQVNTAAQAAQALQQAWNKLLSNDLTAEEVQAITAELAPVLTSLQALKSSRQTTTATGGTEGSQP